MSKKAIADIYQNEKKVATVYQDRSITWTNPLIAPHFGEEKFMANVIQQAPDIDRCMGVVLGVMKLSDYYEDTQMSFKLLVSSSFQAQGDVVS